MSRGPDRHILFVAAFLVAAFLGCHGDRTKDTAKKSQPDRVDTLRYSLPRIEVNCPAEQFRFKIDENTGQHYLSGTVTLVGCQENITSLTEMDRSRLVQHFGHFAREHPLRLAALCWSSNDILQTREALESMERYRFNLLRRLNAEFKEPKIISFSCEMLFGENV
jgi:hypothetical protein